MMDDLPGGVVTTRPLHFIFICDCSGAMNAEGKIQSLNEFVKNCITDIQEEASHHEYVQFLVRVVTFSDGAQWHVSTPTPVEDFRWSDLTAAGPRDIGAAMRLVAEQLRVPPLEEYVKRPVLVLVSSGGPTDDFEDGLKALIETPGGKGALRIAIAIGGADVAYEHLRAFVADQRDDVPVLTPATFGSWLTWN